MKKIISTEKLPIKLWLDDIEEGALKQAKNIDIVTDVSVENVTQLDDCSQVILSNGDKIETKLVIAADSRFSDIRRNDRYLT